MFEFHCPRLTALDIQTTEARAHLKDCCTPRSPRVHVKSIARINGRMSAWKLCSGGAQRVHTRRALDGGACKSEGLLHNPHAAYAVSGSLSQSDLTVFHGAGYVCNP